MKVSDVLLALLVVFIWGLNFLFVKLGLEEISPLLLCAIRFLLASVPAIFFIKPPKTSYRIVISYGLVMFALQFSLIFVGMNIGMTPGMASLILQMQVFFSMFFAVLILGEKPHLAQFIGALVSFLGIGLVALHFDKNISLGGFIFLLAGAAVFGIGNLITKKAKKINMLALVVWGSFAASFPMFLLSLAFEGPQRIAQSFHHLTWFGVSSVVYIVYASTLIGYGVWNYLVSHYPVGMIVPFSLLVPIIAVLSSILILGEPFQAWKLEAGLLVITGLCINLLGSRSFGLKLSPVQPSEIEKSAII